MEIWRRTTSYEKAYILNNEKERIRNKSIIFSVVSLLILLWALGSQKDSFGNVSLGFQILLTSCIVLPAVLLFYYFFYRRFYEAVHGKYIIANAVCIEKTYQSGRSNSSCSITVSIADKFTIEHIRVSEELYEKINYKTPVLVAALYDNPVLPDKNIEVDVRDIRILLESDLKSYKKTCREQLKNDAPKVVLKREQYEKPLIKQSDISKEYIKNETIEKPLVKQTDTPKVNLVKETYEKPLKKE